jgi:predicted RNA binding protein YcfA (HicA-like mRNA interferase family)
VRLTAQTFACYTKACAPPPAGKGGSTKAGHEARRQAIAVHDHAVAIEKGVTDTLRSTVLDQGGALVGLTHRVKGIDSLTRKIHDKALQRHQSMAESANAIPDALRYTAVLHSSKYTAAVKSTRKALEKQGFKIEELETHWQRGDAYNGVHMIARHPNGAKVEIQFHTVDSLRAKALTHPIYEKARQATTTPQERTMLTKKMVEIADHAKVPKGATGLGTKVFRPAA